MELIRLPLKIENLELDSASSGDVWYDFDGTFQEDTEISKEGHANGHVTIVPEGTTVKGNIRFDWSSIEDQDPDDEAYVFVGFSVTVTITYDGQNHLISSRSFEFSNAFIGYDEPEDTLWDVMMGSETVIVIDSKGDEKIGYLQEDDQGELRVKMVGISVKLENENTIIPYLEIDTKVDALLNEYGEKMEEAEAEEKLDDDTSTYYMSYFPKIAN